LQRLTLVALVLPMFMAAAESRVRAPELVVNDEAPAPVRVSPAEEVTLSVPALFCIVDAVPVSKTVSAPESALRLIWPLVSLSIFSRLVKVMSPPAPVLKVRPVVPWTTRLEAKVAPPVKVKSLAALLSVVKVMAVTEAEPTVIDVAAEPPPVPIDSRPALERSRVLPNTVPVVVMLYASAVSQRKYIVPAGSNAYGIFGYRTCSAS
jgi:hypothetical protein